MKLAIIAETAEEARALIELWAGKANPTAQPASAPTAAPPPPASSAAPPPPASSAALPLLTAAPTAAPTPAGGTPPLQPRNGQHVNAQQTLQAMNTYAQQWKAAGCKVILSKCGLQALTGANQEQLNWLYDAFVSQRDPATF